MTEVAVTQRAVPLLALVGRLSSDERLAQLASRGDWHAFELLYERHRQALYGYCRSIVRHDEDAQDALQSAMMRALAALQASERDIAVRPWLFRIVHNEAVSLLRRRRLEDRPIDRQELTHASVEHTVEGRERLATLVADIQSLSERQRTALLMRELSGLSIDEIAAALATTSGAAKQSLFEARCALHELAEGRAMECDVVRRTLSERDGRVLRGRKLRAHLRACAGCVQFRALIEARGADLRALVPPLPTGGALGLLAHAAGIGAGHASEAVAISGAAFSGSAAVSLVAKGLAGAAIVTAATAGTAELARHHGQPVASPPPQATWHVAAPAQAPARVRHAPAHPGAPSRSAPRAGHDAIPRVAPHSQPGDAAAPLTAAAPAPVVADPPPVPSPEPTGTAPSTRSGHGAPHHADAVPPGHGGEPPGQSKPDKPHAKKPKPHKADPPPAPAEPAPSSGQGSHGHGSPAGPKKPHKQH